MKTFEFQYRRNNESFKLTVEATNHGKAIAEFKEQIQRDPAVKIVKIIKR